jgi:hypothetical protein
VREDDELFSMVLTDPPEPISETAQGAIGRAQFLRKQSKALFIKRAKNRELTDGICSR